MFAEGDNRLKVDYSSVPWAIFTYPQIGHVGMTEAEAIEKGYKIYCKNNIDVLLVSFERLHDSAQRAF